MTMYSRCGVGWLTDHGQHACDLRMGHLGWQHECGCGSAKEAAQRPLPNGTGAAMSAWAARAGGTS